MRLGHRLEVLLIVACFLVAGRDVWAGTVLLVGAANGNSVERYDGRTGQFLGFFTNGGPFDGSNSSLAIGANGNLFTKGWSTNQSVLQYDGTTGAFINTFAAPTSGAASAILFGPDGNLYAEGPFPGGQINRYNGTTGALLGTFVPSGSGGLVSIGGMRFGPDGNLYVCNDFTAGSNVLRYNGTSGAFIDVFVAARSGIGCEDILFGPDGNLYVADGENGPNPAVRRYNGSTGAFLDIFADDFAAGGALVIPFGLAFGPDGNLYASIMTGDVADGVLRFDGTTGAFVDVFADTTNVNPTYILFAPSGRCGDGAVDPGEECDDGNTQNGDGCSATCESENRTPDCGSAAPSIGQLWPPNHKFRDVSVTGVTDPDGDSVSITITGIAQDEPTNASGDGNTCPDGSGTGTSIASLRSERAGSGDGRVYDVTFSASDGKGGVCTGTVEVCVPHDFGGGGGCVDQGPLFDSTACASASTKSKNKDARN